MRRVRGRRLQTSFALSRQFSRPNTAEPGHRHAGRRTSASDRIRGLLALAHGRRGPGGRKILAWDQIGLFGAAIVCLISRQSNGIGCSGQRRHRLKSKYDNDLAGSFGSRDQNDTRAQQCSKCDGFKCGKAAASGGGLPIRGGEVERSFALTRTRPGIASGRARRDRRATSSL